MAPIQDNPPFYAPWIKYGKKLSFQWDEMRKNTDTLNPVARAIAIDYGTVRPNLRDGSVTSWEIGEDGFHNKFRAFWDKSNLEYKIQFNTGTEAVPVWSDAIRIKNSGGNVTVVNGFSVLGGFYGTFPRQIQTVDETGSGGANSYNSVSRLRFNVENGFYLSSDAQGNPVVNMEPGGGALTSATNLGAGSQVFKQQVTTSLEFRTLTAGSNVTLTQSANEIQIASTGGGGGFYGITAKQSNGAASYRGINVLSFESDNFYLTQNSPNTDEVQVNFRGSSAGTGDITNATNLGAGSGVFASKSGSNLQFKSLVAGSNISLSSSGTEVTITGTGGGGGGGGFYGVIFKESGVGGSTFRNDTLIVDSDNFYLTSSGTGKPLLALHANQTLGVVTLTGSLSLAEQAASPAVPDATHGVIWASDNNGHTSINFMDNQGSSDQYEFGRDSMFICRNVTGSTITRGAAIYISGTTGNVPQISLAKADSESTLPCFGVAAADIANNGYGRVMRIGRITSVNLAAYSAGDRLYVSPTSAGALTNVEPTHPNLSSIVGYVVDASANGVMAVTVTRSTGSSSGTIKSSFTVGPTAATSVVLQPASTAQRTATFQDRSGTVAYTSDIGPSFYGLITKATGRPQTFKKTVLKFNGSDFYITPENGTGVPIVNFKGGAINAAAASTFGTLSEWEFTHNLNTANVVWSTYDDQGEAIIPQRVDISNPNIAYFYLTPATAGRAVLVAVNGTTSGGGGSGSLNTVNEANPNGTTFSSPTKLRFNTGSGFYLSHDSTGAPVVNFHDHVEALVAGSNISLASSGSGAGKTITITGTGGAGSVTFESGVQSQTSATVEFNPGHFYMTKNAAGVPMINLSGVKAALVYLSADVVYSNIDSTRFRPIQFTAVDYDTNGWWNASTNENKWFKVPAAVDAAFVRITGQLQGSDISSSNTAIRVKKNGKTVPGLPSMKASTSVAQSGVGNALNLVSPPIRVVTGDTFYMEMAHNGSINVKQFTTWFSIEKVA